MMILTIKKLKISYHLKWKMKSSEKLYKLLCTHISEQEEPNDSDTIQDFKTRWLANMSFHGIELSWKSEGGFEFLTKTVKGKKQITLAFKGDILVLAYYYPLNSGAQLDTLKNNKDSIKAAKILGIDFEEIYDWQERDMTPRVKTLGFFRLTVSRGSNRTFLIKHFFTAIWVCRSPR